MLPRATTRGIVAILLATAALSLPVSAVAASECDGRTPTLGGTDGNDQIVGTPFDDVIDAGAGDDRIEAGSGNDTICGGRGADVIDAGDGADLVDPGVETSDQDESGLRDEIDGGDGSDTLTYESAPLPVAVLLDRGEASTAALNEDDFNPVGIDSFDRIENVTGTDNATTPQGDFFAGARGSNTFVGLGGNDFILGAGGADVLDGGEGFDIARFDTAPRGVRVDLAAGTASGQGADRLISFEGVFGSPHDDVLLGDRGDDFLDGAAGADLMRGAGGDDDLYPDPYYESPSDDVIRGGPGDGDAVYFQTGSEEGVTVDAGAGTVTGHGRDLVSAVEKIQATANDDVFRGGSGNDSFNAGGGNDVVLGRGGSDHLEGGTGDDRLDGGRGLDTLSYFGDPDGVVVRIDLGTSTGSGDDTFEGFEWYWGSHGNDEIRGGPAADLVSGIEGDDTIHGGGGDDLLDGSEGHDVVHGEGGRDGCEGEETFTCEAGLEPG